MSWVATVEICEGRGPQKPAHLDGVCGIDSDLIVGLITVWEAKVEVLRLDVYVREDELQG